MKHLKRYAILIPLLALFCSCSKGYEVRFTNYYIEDMDSVVVGSNKLVLTDIRFEQTTPYYKINRGNYSITCISKSKKKFYSSFNIPGNGSGKRTIQIDGIHQIAVLEE